MKIGILNSTVLDGTLRLECTVSRAKETRQAFFELPEEFAQLAETGRSDAFLLALLLVAVMDGEDIHVAGSVSAELLRNLNFELIPILNAFNPNYRRIRITADHCSSERRPLDGRGVGTGLSGGVDSFCCIREHLNDDIPQEHRLTHLFFFNVGSHGMGRTPEELARIERKFRLRFEAMKPCAEMLGLPLIPVNSNLHSFFDCGHLESCSLVTPAAALLFQKGLHEYLLASGGHDYRDKLLQLTRNREDGDLAEIDPLILPYLGTEDLNVRATETRLRRIDKLRLIADYAPAQKFLNVCCSHDAMQSNCSVCEKCATTIVMLELLDSADNFSSVFDLNKYHRLAEKDFIAKCFRMRRKEPFFASILELAQAQKVNLRSRTARDAILWAYFKDSAAHNLLRRIPGLRAGVRTLKKRF